MTLSQMQQLYYHSFISWLESGLSGHFPDSCPCDIMLILREIMTYPGSGEEELIPIVKCGHERLDLDYKAPVNWDEWPNRNKVELVRDMMGLANSEVPGYIVIGATDEGGVVRSWDGLSEQQIESFDPSKIADKIKRYSDPEVHFYLYKPTVENKRYVVILVLPFRVEPHVCRTSYDDILEEAAVYIRGEGARTIKVPSAEYMRRIVNRAIQIRADELVVDWIRWLGGAAEKEKTGNHHRFYSQITELKKQLEKKPYNALDSIAKSVTVSATTPTEPVAVTSPPEKTYTPSLPAGMGAFKGRVLWGDKLLLSSKVVAGTKHPVVIYTPKPTKMFIAETDKDGNYRIIVEPDSYYIGCSMPGSDYLSYVTLGALPGIWGVYSHQVETSQVVTVDLQAVDWSIELVSPGDTDYDTTKTISENTPTLKWQDYDWAKYGETGYYQIELGIYEDGYHTVMKDKIVSNSYVIVNPLKAGKYSWQVKAYTKTDKPIAGHVQELYFLVPSPSGEIQP